MIKCQKCGQENPEDAKFCNSCGEKLEQKQKYKCSKCGKEFAGEVAYCNGCGSKMVYAKEDEAYAIKIGKNNKQADSTERTQINSNKLAITRIAVTNGLLILATLLMMISVYLPFTKANAAGLKETRGLTYLFKDIWDAIKSGYLTKFSKAINITQFVLFICTSILSLVFGVLTIIKATKGIVRKSDKLLTKTLTGVYVPTLIYFVFGLISNYAKVVYSGGQVAKSTYGAGGVMAIIAMAIMLLALIFNKVMRFVNKEETRYISSSLGFLMAIVAFIIPLVSFASLIFMEDSDTSVYLNIQSLIENVSAYSNMDITMLLSYISETFLLLTVGLTVVLFVLTNMNILNRRANLPALIISSLVFAFSISLVFVSKETAVNILADANGGTKETYDAIKAATQVGPSAIALIVLSASMVGTSIASLAVRNK